MLNVFINLFTILSIKLRNSFIKDQNILSNHKIQRNMIIDDSTDEESKEKVTDQKDDLINSIKTILLDWLKSPYFALHICRICVIIIFIFYKSYISTLLFSW